MSNIIISATVEKIGEKSYKLTAKHPATAEGTIVVASSGKTLESSSKTISPNTKTTSWTSKILPAPVEGDRFVFTLDNDFDVIY